jgi:hypothetical protein
MAKTKAFMNLEARLASRPLYFAGKDSHKVVCAQCTPNPPPKGYKKITARVAWNDSFHTCSSCGWRVG